MNRLFFDTETTGLWNWKAGIESPGQPELVQLGVILTDSAGAIRAKVDLIVLPNGVIPEGATATHGISTGDAQTYGVSNTAAALIFDDLMACADVIIAHNLAFDILIMRRAFHLANLPARGFDEVDMICTKLATTPVCKIKHKRPRHANDFKWPTLDEAHRYFFDTGVEGAHSAMPDVEACQRVFLELEKMDALAAGFTPRKGNAA